MHPLQSKSNNLHFINGASKGPRGSHNSLKPLRKSQNQSLNTVPWLQILVHFTESLSEYNQCVACTVVYGDHAKPALWWPMEDPVSSSQWGGKSRAESTGQDLASLYFSLNPHSTMCKLGDDEQVTYPLWDSFLKLWNGSENSNASLTGFL